MIIRGEGSMKQRGRWFKKGIRDGIPVGLGYLAVSFTLGIAAKKAGLTAAQAGVMSLTNLTSAGEFAALGLITAQAAYSEMAATQLIINLRYCLMSFALSQKIHPKAGTGHRMLVAAGVTDEIFGLTVSVPEKLSPWYTYGMMCMAVPGWTFGTILGVISGGVLPERVLSAMGVALYAMFIAVIVPPCRENRIVVGVICVSMAAGTLMTYLPVVREISSGSRIIILTVVIAGIAAVLFPVKDGGIKEEGKQKVKEQKGEEKYGA